MDRSYSLTSSSSSKRQTKYDVFLSFRGEDTRNTFTSHLYAALCRKGIHTFLDDDKLERGKSISPELLKAIEESSCSIIIFSKNYASSTWCLDELVKILQCKKDYVQIVLPIFYHVDPSHVRKQSGSIGEAFERHEQVFSHNVEKVQSWRDALKEVGNLAGWHLHNRDEAKFLEDLIAEVSSKVGVARLYISEDLFGMDSRLEQLNNCVCNSSLNDVRFIGICGMGGIGKTTLAKAYYEWISSQFECFSFLASVREVCEKKENGLVYLQNHLLSDILNGLPREARNIHEGKNMIRSRLCHKKVLIVLDDVNKLDQLTVLAEEDNWFGSGSIILITTRDKSLLQSTYKECRIYRVEQLNDSEGFQLFSCKAFKRSHPLEDYTELSKQVIAYAKGLPLALEVLGSFLCGKTINEWESALHRLKEYPEKKIVKVLQISFDGLEETEKNIFLDIACFFNGLDKDYIIEIMDCCGFHPRIGIRSLIDKSLLHNDPDNKLWMHDLLQEMGIEIVREKSRDEPGRWNRLWDSSALCHVFENNKGAEEVEAIVWYSRESQKVLNWEAFSNMMKLRLLIIEFPPMRFHHPPLAYCSVDDLAQIAYLPNELRILRWTEFPFASLPPNFQADRLVELMLPRSFFKQLWNNLVKPLYNLKILDLSYSKNFRKFEDFKVVPNLEKLILEHCSGLVEVHLSITFLRRLTLLNLNHCISLVNLPTSINGLKSLKILQLNNCTRLGNLPEDLAHLNRLEELHLGCTSISDLPSSVFHCTSIRDLTCGRGFSNSQQRKTMMNTIVGKGLILGGLYSLKKLDLRSCSLEEGAIPDNFDCLVSLEDLNLANNYFSSLPTCINQLSKLKILNLILCENLKSLGPELPPSLEMVWVDKCTSLDTFLDPLNDQCNLHCSASCQDCLNLVRRQGSKRTSFVSLKRYLQNPPIPSKRLDIVLPGNEIPAWFTHQRFGPSISLQLDPNWCSSKWMGFAISVFRRKMHVSCTCIVRIDGQDWEFGLVERPGYYSTCGDHLWLFYLPRDIYFQAKWKNYCGRIEFSIEIQNFIQTYTNNDFGCGIRLVYEQDIEGLNLHNEDEDVDIRNFLQSQAT